MPRPRFSGRRLALAFTMAALADGLSVLLTFTPPVQWAADLVTAILLFMVLGWQWILLPGLVMESIPGLYIFPFWVLVVGAVAVWGTARPELKSMRGNHDKTEVLNVHDR
jgi:MFS superfamily sulfate permease-like transporter